MTVPSPAPDPTATWDLSDAWILAAVGQGCRHDEMSGLISAADYYNHAIPAETEVAQALGRLVASGLIAREGRVLAPTTAGRALWQRSEGGGYRRVESLYQALRATSLVEGIWPLEPGALSRAYRRYTRWSPWMWFSKRGSD